MNEDNDAAVEVDASALSRIDHRPTWTSEDVRAVVASTWNIRDAEVTELASERDQNWAIQTPSGNRFVLKIANSDDERTDIDLQQSMMKRLAVGGVPVPQPVLTIDGESLIVRDDHLLWLMNFLTGKVLASVIQPPQRLFTHLGETAARITSALAGFDHPAAHRQLQWDVQNAEDVLGSYLPYVSVREDRILVEKVLATFQTRVSPRLGHLEFGVIHNDLNDHNVLVADAAVSGVIDFGDAVHSARINELAIACTYAMLERPDPLKVMSTIVAGYARIRPIAEAEQAVLLDLVMTRLATSVSISAYQGRAYGADHYLRVSEAQAWRLMNQLDGAL